MNNVLDDKRKKYLQYLEKLLQRALREIKDDIPIHASERKWLDEMSRILLFADLRFDIKTKTSEELSRKLRPYVEKFGTNSALLTRITVHALELGLRTTDWKREFIREAKIRRQKWEKFRCSYEGLKSAYIRKRTFEKFLPDFFSGTLREDDKDIEYYRSYYHAWYNKLYSKFLEYCIKTESSKVEV